MSSYALSIPRTFKKAVRRARNIICGPRDVSAITASLDDMQQELRDAAVAHNRLSTAYSQLADKHNTESYRANVRATKLKDIFG